MTLKSQFLKINLIICIIFDVNKFWVRKCSFYRVCPMRACVHACVRVYVRACVRAWVGGQVGVSFKRCFFKFCLFDKKDVL